MKRAAVYALSCLLAWAGLPLAAQADIVGTETVIAAASRAEQLSRIDRVLQTETVRAKLLEYGVERAQIDARLAALTDTELASLADRLESAPAGGDALAIIGATFLVLLILEVVGVIDIFKTVGPARR